jgi:hypothetical protein
MPHDSIQKREAITVLLSKTTIVEQITTYKKTQNYIIGREFFKQYIFWFSIFMTLFVPKIVFTIKKFYLVLVLNK